MLTHLYPITREFEELFDNFTTTLNKSAPNYPPYSLSVKDDSGLIEIACTGLSEKDIQIYIDDDGLLVVEGKYPKDEEKEYIHRGLSKKDFTRKFRLEKFTVDSVKLENGLLQIFVKKEQPVKQLIPINSEKSIEMKAS